MAVTATVAIGGGRGAQIPEQLVHQGEAIEAVLAGPRLATDHLFGGGLELGSEVFVTHVRISCA